MLSKERYLIGIDSGASFSKISLFKNGKLIRQIRHFASLSKFGLGEEKRLMVLDNLVENLRRYKEADWVLAVAGVDNEIEKRRFEKWFRLNLSSLGVIVNNVVVINDTELVLYAGGSRSGVALVAGTGSNCIGVNHKGEKAKCGGMGKDLSDEGSGYSIGLKGMKVATKMMDGRLKKTDFVNKLLKVYGVKNLTELKEEIENETNPKKMIARTAKLVISEARNGGDVFKEIVDLEIYELVGLVLGVMKKLGDTDLPLYLYGSLFANKYFLDRFEKMLHRVLPAVDADVVMVEEGFLRALKGI